ncbi:COP9 signalosome complex subunit 4 [Coemansia sp. RSA 2336]|nr:COP9 signalosome complex subunit 4 [Coemansia sp. RSA 2336]
MSTEIAAQLSALFRSDTLDTVESSARAANKFIMDKLDLGNSQHATAQCQTLAAIVDACVDEQLPQTISTAVLGELIKMMSQSASELSQEVRQTTLEHLLCKVQQRTSAFETAIIEARQALADILVAEEKWEEAAQQLQGIRLEQSQRSYTSKQVFELYITTAELFLKADRFDQAVKAQGRAAALLIHVKDIELVNRYRYVQARISDLSQKYIDAANTYYTIFQTDLNNAAKQTNALERAIKCAVLASAGPQKVRIMTALYREKLASSLSCFGFLEKMVLKRLIKPDELQQFSEQLEEHQRSLLADGKTTILEHAVREHNIFMLSSLYSNIKFENLGLMLGVDSEDAEQMCARMIAESRMKGRIDQVDGVVTFEGAREVKEVSAAIFLKSQVAAQPPPMHFRESIAAKWDERIVKLCTAVEDSVDLLIERQPVYTKMLFRSADV